MSPVRNFFLEIGYPFQKVFYGLGRDMDEFFSFLGSIGSMRNENADLIRENNSLASQVAALQEVKSENNMLRQQLSLAPRNKYDLEASLVIGQDPQSLGSWITIDKGSSEGIAVGMPVIVSDGILVGKISAIGMHSAKVSLLTDSATAVDVNDSETGAKGIIKGAYGLGIIMDMVSQSDVLNVGDTIVTSGLSGDIPSGLLVGKIQEVRLSPDKLFQQAIVMPRLRYDNLDMVFIIKR